MSRPLIKKYGKQFQGARDIEVHQTDDQHIFHAYDMMKIKEQSMSMQFTVNTYISACSCDTGQSGAPCIHQVAVSTKLATEATNLLPIYQKEKRRLFAQVALGKRHNSDLGFYAAVHEKVLHAHTAHQSISEADVHAVSLPEDGTNSTVAEDGTNSTALNPDASMTQDKVTMNSDLHGILQDLKLRVENGDHNLQKGLQKFIHMYKRLQSGPAPSASIATALHHFGRNYGKITEGTGGRLLIFVFCCRYTMEYEKVWKVYSCAINSSKKKTIRCNKGKQEMH